MFGLNENLEFDGLSPEDFDAFTQEKWNSNMFTLPRRRVKSKLAQLGGLLEQQLKQQSLPLVMHLSDEFPSLWNKKLVDSLWLFFSRDEEAQAALTSVIDKERTLATTLADPTPRYRQVFLGAAVTEAYLEVGLRLHHDAWVDRDNLLRKIETGEGVASLVGLLRELPAHYVAGIVDDDLRSPSTLDGSALVSLCGRLQKEGGWLFIGARLPRDQVCVLGKEVAASVLDVMGRVVSIYKCLAWSPANDAISLERIALQHEQDLQRSHEQLERERIARAEQLAARERDGQKLRAEIEERVREQDAWRSRELAARRAAAARIAEEEKRDEARARAEAMAAKWSLPKSEAAPEPQASAAPEPQPPTVRPAQSAPEQPPVPESCGLCVGDHVEVIRGFLTGRRGVLQELDDKGGARINFGAMSSRLVLEDLRKARSHEGHRPKSENQAALTSNHAKVGQQKRDAVETERGPSKPRGTGFSEG
ncbi:MAG: hypothetical protein MUC50_01575 [Myxococcota bacterium]|nr:hypothetical protein [Myxococcota bacterium]